MTRAFPWLLIVFASVFLVFLLIQVLVLVPGVRIALSGYDLYQKKEFEALATTILVDPAVQPKEALRYSNPFFVFSPEGQLLYSNRGKGYSIPKLDLQPVAVNGKTIGYYYAGDLKFVDDRANRLFFSNLQRLAVVSLIASLALGLLVSVFASRRIAGPVRLLQNDISEIESRRRIGARRFSIAELTDISASLEKLSALLAAEEEYKRQWMQDIAHDLRTPISGLKSQLEGMRDGVLEPDAARFDRNLTEIERLEELVKGISELYAAENVHDLDIETFPSDEFISEVLAPHEMTKRTKRLTVKVDVDTDLIQADRHLLLRAVGNIVANAFAYTPADGTINVAVRTEDSTCRIEVADTGQGIPSDQLEKIFHRFFRGEFGRATSGTGLGLNIAKTIVERHGGSITVKNLEPAGASFSVKLPAPRRRRR